MVSVQEIDAAIAAHAFWKVRLRLAIDTGHLEVPVEVVAADDACDFGKWLKQAFAGGDAADSRHYAAVKARHADFHKIAARVVELAFVGDKAEAERMLAFGGEYTVASANLTAAMLRWRKSAETAPAEV